MTKTPSGRICYRGEGTRSQIERDLKKVSGNESEILPVIGNRKTIPISVSIILGFGIGFLAHIGYENLFKKRKKHR